MTRSKAEAKRRKLLYRESLAAISTLSSEELKNMRFELGRQMGEHNRLMNDLRLRLEAVKMEEQRRKTLTSVPGIHISDHAVVRYLERHKGLDVAAVRDEIATIAHRADRLSDGKKGIRQDSSSGLILGVDEDTRHVTTIYKPQELIVIS